MSRQPIHLVPPANVHHDLSEILDGLLNAARSGAMTGLVFGVSFRDQRYYCDVAGSLHRNRVLALGVARLLCGDIERSISTSEDTIF
jgi:hypothetical protein